MNIEKLGLQELDLLIVLEEFRYWDAKRNHVPANELEKISLKISSLKLQKPRLVFIETNLPNLTSPLITK